MIKPTKGLGLYSLEELEKEVKKRKDEIAEEEKKKKCVSFSQEVQDIVAAVEFYGSIKKQKIDITLFKMFLAACQSVVDQIKNHSIVDEEDANDVFQYSMKFVYGKDFFKDFYNKYC